MIIDCDMCAMQETEACNDCVVTALFEAGAFDLDDDEKLALEHLAEAGLVSRLRMVPRAS